MNNKIEEQAELRAIVEGFFSKSMLARSPTKVDMLVQELSEHTAKQKEKLEKELVAWIEHEAPVTTVQNIEPLANGQYVKVKNLLAHLSSKEQESKGDQDA